MNNKDNKKKVNVHFSAINPYIEINAPIPEEKELSNAPFIAWGDRNQYPYFLKDLYYSVPTLQSIINSVVDYVVGDKVTSNIASLTSQEAEELVGDMALSYAIYGGYALNIIRNRLGGVAKVVSLDFGNVRSDKKNETLYYSPDFASKTFGRVRYTIYPAFKQEDTNILTSIYYHKNMRYKTYPVPVHQAAVNACLIEKNVQEFQLNETVNGFASNLILSFNNGIPTEEAQEEIEDMIDEKFDGYQNAGRPLIVWNQDKEHSIEVTKIDTDNFVDKYNTTMENARNMIYASWRMNPNLTGYATEGNGFSGEEYENTFKIFNRMTIQPIQKMICNSLDEIFGYTGSITIKPFSIAGETEDEVENNNDSNIA